MSVIPVFTSPKGRSEIMGAYQAVMDRWPIAMKN
jgi:hypothetical protein